MSLRAALNTDSGTLLMRRAVAGCARSPSLGPKWRPYQPRLAVTGRGKGLGSGQGRGGVPRAVHSQRRTNLCVDGRPDFKWHRWLAGSSEGRHCGTTRWCDLKEEHAGLGGHAKARRRSPTPQPIVAGPESNSGASTIISMSTPSSSASRRLTLAMSLAAALTLPGYLWGMQSEGASPSLSIIAVIVAVTIAALAGAVRRLRWLQAPALAAATLGAAAFGLVLLTSYGWTMLLAAGFGAAAILTERGARKATLG